MSMSLIPTHETRLPAHPGDARLAQGEPAGVVAKADPTCTLAWAVLAEEALSAGRTVEGYAFARTGYHRSLDALRRAGWRGQGPVPWAHEPNRGFLRSLAALTRAAAEVGEVDEEERCSEFLRASSPEAARALGL